MDDKKRRQQSQSDSDQQRGEFADQDSRQDVSNEQSQNPRGSDSQYEEASTEMDVSGDSGENFYRNRERGNFEPGQASEEGGGSLY